MKNFLLNEHLTITHKEKDNSLIRKMFYKFFYLGDEPKEKKIIHIEVKSQLLKDEPIFDDLTLDSEMAIHYDNQLRYLLNDL